MSISLIRRSTLAALATIVLAAAPAVFARSATKKELFIGATAGSNVDVLKLGTQPQLEKKGYKVKVVEFNDDVQPNLALAQGALDVNYVQHIIYLKKFAQDQKLKLVPLDAAQLPRSLGDVEYATVNGNFAISPGLKLTEALVLDKNFAGHARPAFLQ